MTTPELLDYIRKELSKGRSREEIRKALIAGGGWSEDDLSEAFRIIIPMENTVPAKPATLVGQTEMKPVSPLSPVSAPTLAPTPVLAPTPTINPVLNPTPTPAPIPASFVINPSPEKSSSIRPASPLFTPSPAFSSKPTPPPPLPTPNHSYMSSFLKFLIIFLVVFGLGFGFWYYRSQVSDLWNSLVEKVASPSSNTNPVVPIENEEPVNLEDTLPKISGNRDDLVSFSIVPGQSVSGVISVNGSVKGGYFFEGNILINILDVDKKLLKQGNAMAKTEWMTSEPVFFEGSIDFSGLEKGPAYVEIHNDNASGLPENDKMILVPVVIE